MTSDMIHLQVPETPGPGLGRPSTAGGFRGSIFNPVLIGVAIIYVIWSWVHLPSSIWARCLLACYLIWRMQPDIIIPFVLSCVQLRLDLSRRDGFDDAQDLALQMTGFEQYAFMIPCVLYPVRTFFAALSARVARRADFPFWLYGLYVLGLIPVVVGAISARGEPGWTGGARDYFVVGLYFYGLLMPACSKEQLMQVVLGFTVLGLIYVLANLLVGYHSRQLWVLLPIAGSFAPLVILSRGKLRHCFLAASYSVAAVIFAIEATFTLVLLWAWNTIAGVILGPFRRPGLRSALVTGLTYALLAMTLTMFFYAALFHDPSRDLYETVKGGQGSTFNRMTFKLLSDRGPIWWGAMLDLHEHPTYCGIPAPKFMFRSLGKEAIWPYSSHSILLDPLLRLGFMAGPIVLLILVHAVMVARNAVAREADIGLAVLGLAVISNIVLGGATLPYMLNERASEHMYIVAGLLGFYGMRNRGAQVGGSNFVPRVGTPPRALPAA